MDRSYRHALAIMGLLSFLLGCKSKSPFEKRDGTWYYREQAIDGADAGTFAVLSDHYAKDARRVFYCDTYRESKDYFLTRHNRVLVVDGADAPAFRYLDQDYGRDAANVYYEGVRFAVKDLATFALLEYGFARDRITGYYHQVPITGSDGSTFTFIDSHYSKDAAHVFYSDLEPGKDGGRPTRKTLSIDGVHVGTFTALEYGYAMDSAHVYYQGRPLTKDPQSFRVLEIGYAVSKDRVYYYGVAVPDADPATFSVLDTPADGMDARDASTNYLQGRKTDASKK